MRIGIDKIDPMCACVGIAFVLIALKHHTKFRIVLTNFAGVRWVIKKANLVPQFMNKSLIPIIPSII